MCAPYAPDSVRRVIRTGSRHLPDDWEVISSDGPGPFVTRMELRRPDGSVVSWRSRGHRKRASGLSWWIGLGFALGSICFAVASFACQWSSVSRPGIGITFFVGSVFFTAAAYGQHFQSVNVEPDPDRRRPLRSHLRPASWNPGRIDWLASAVQLAGTIFFNISTFLAMQDNLTAHQSNLRVWAPDAFGSVCFLVASELALAEVCHRWVCAKNRTQEWWIAALNMVGSIAFGVSALTSIIEPSTDEPVSAVITNAGTTVGAVCFLAGAVLLMREARASRPD
jgi:hypothetical protein